MCRRPPGETSARTWSPTAGHELGEGPGLTAGLSRTAGVVLKMVLDSNVVNVTARAAGIEAKGQHVPGARARVVHRHRTRLVRRLSGERAGVAGRVGTAAVTGDPDVRSTRDRGRDGTPASLRGGPREAVRAGRVL